jgi:phosphoribosylamine--glycine ligase
MEETSGGRSMRVMLAGRWAKAHAMAKSLAANPDLELVAAMDRDNPGIRSTADSSVKVDLTDAKAVADAAESVSADFVVVSPQMTMQAGARELLEEKEIPCFCPSAACARLEGDKVYTRNLLQSLGIDASPAHRWFDDQREAIDYLREVDHPVAVKPAGVTEGDGVKVMGLQLEDFEAAESYVRRIFEEGIGGMARVLIEERMRGEEFSLQVFMDGEHMAPMPVVRDYKLLEEGESGPNTPGMGSYSMPDHLLPTVDEATVGKGLGIMEKVMDYLREEEGQRYTGILTGQFMLPEQGLRLVEFNVRAGDSEFLNVQPLLQTDMMAIMQAIDAGELHRVRLRFENSATVCKYLVPKGFPDPEGTVAMVVDGKAARDIGCRLFYSCFENGDGTYEPSPRLMAVTGVAETRREAWERCEEGIRHVDGQDLYHRRDIGTKKLARKYQ